MGSRSRGTHRRASETRTTDIIAQLQEAILALLGYEIGHLGDDRSVIPMSSGVRIPPNTSAQITTRPQLVAFRPERIVIAGVPGGWVVDDIRIGDRSQLPRPGGMSGEAFSASVVSAWPPFDPVLVGMDFVVLVTYVGPKVRGEPFACLIINKVT